MILNDRRTFGSPAGTHLNTGGAWLSFHIQLQTPCTPPIPNLPPGQGKKQSLAHRAVRNLREEIIGDVIRSSPLREARWLIKGKAVLTWAFTWPAVSQLRAEGRGGKATQINEKQIRTQLIGVPGV